MYFTSPHRTPIARTLLAGAIALAVAVVALIGSGAPPASAAFHCMRVGAVMGGANGNADIQYVELRLSAAGQNIVGGHEITFRDDSGAGPALVTFTFPSSVGSGASGASILVATAEFDAVATVNPDFLFSDGTVVDPDTSMTVPSNTTGTGDRNHPVLAPTGMVSFEESGPTCLGGMSPSVDSVAYGTGFDPDENHYGDPVSADLPITGKQALVVDNLAITPSDNSMEYSVQTIPEPIPPPSGPSTPRNNAGATGDIGGDADGDGIDDSVDNCPSTPNMGQENVVHPGTPAGDHCEDPDSDGDFDANDNCPDTANADQRNTDGDGLGDVCDPDVDGDAILNTSDVDDDGDNYLDADETSKGSDPINPGSKPEHCQGTDDDGDTVVDEPPAASGRSTPDPLCPGGADPDGDTIMNSSDTDDDDDAFSDVAERSMSVDELDDCPNINGHDAWPPDAVANGTANIGDVSFMFGMGKILQSVGQPNYSARSDANGNGAVNVGDVSLFFGGGVILTSC